MEIRVETTIEMPRDEVFAAFTDIAGAPQRISGITGVEMLADPGIPVGTRWRETRKIFGREGTEEMEITEADPGMMYRVESDGHGTRYTSVLRFEELDSGATHVTMSFAGQPTSWFARLLSPLGRLMQGSARRMLQQDLADMKAFLEGTGGEPAVPIPD